MPLGFCSGGFFIEKIIGLIIIMKVAIIGYGGRGRLYSTILKDKDAEIVAICDLKMAGRPNLV